MDIESVSDELYGLPLDEFIPIRTEREKQAKSTGDKDLAAQIHQLAKPNLVAWLANQLVRERADEIQPMLELGPALREATATQSGERLRELSHQQRQVLHALVQQARRLANAAGRNVSADVARGLEDTLRAALADPDATEALAAGRLTQGMQNSGFGSLAGGHGRPAQSAKEPTADGRSSPAAQQRPREQRTRAEHNLRQAKSDADKATTGRQEISTQLEAAGRTVADTRARVERARQELEDALKAQSEAQKAQRSTQSAFDRADRSERDARQRLAEATERLDRSAR